MEPAPNNVPDLSGSPEDDRVSFHKNLLDSLFDGVYFVDTARKIVYWNQGSENLTGYSAPEALGRHCCVHRHADDRTSTPHSDIQLPSYQHRYQYRTTLESGPNFSKIVKGLGQQTIPPAFCQRDNPNQFLCYLRHKGIE